MSVAFRRESDDEHLEPRFELPIPAGPNLVTAAGPALIAARVAELEAAAAAASAAGSTPRPTMPRAPSASTLALSSPPMVVRAS